MLVLRCSSIAPLYFLTVPLVKLAAMNNDHLSASYFETGNKQLTSLFNTKDETNYTPEDFTKSKRWASPICMLFWGMGACYAKAISAYCSEKPTLHDLGETNTP